jgi:hypothetical protein
MRPVSVADVGLSRRVVVVATASLGAVGGGASLGGWYGLARFAS